MTRTMKTTSSETALLLAQLIPVDYRVKEITTRRYLNNNPSAPFTPSSMRSINDIINKLPEHERLMPSINAELPPYSTLTPPSIILLERKSQISHRSNSPQTLRLFTDGSLIPHASGNKVGYGIAAFNDRKLVAECRGRLPSYATVFQAEGLAILTAVNFAVSKLDQFKSVEVLSDSRAALLACTSKAKVPKIFDSITRTLHSHPGKFHLFWVPSHSGHIGNEYADQLAKEAANSLIAPTDTPCPASYIHTEIKSLINCLWQREWSQSTKSATTHSFFPSILIPHTLFKRTIPPLAMQILAGVAPLNDYLFKLKISPTPLCQCGSPETIPHFLFECHNYAQQRISFRNTVISNNNQWPPLLSIITQSTPIFNAMISFISSTKRSHHNPIT